MSEEKPRVTNRRLVLSEEKLPSKVKASTSFQPTDTDVQKQKLPGKVTPSGTLQPDTSSGGGQSQQQGGGNQEGSKSGKKK